MKRTLTVILSLYCLTAQASLDVKDAIVKIYAVQSQSDYFRPWNKSGPVQGTGSGQMIAVGEGLTNVSTSATLESFKMLNFDFADTNTNWIVAEDMRILHKSAEQGDAFDQRLLGLYYYFGDNVKKSNAEAAKWYLKSAEQGDADAQVLYGYLFYCGDGVEKNFAEAVKWFRKSAEQGQADAQCNLGVCYENGTGVTKDHAEAIKWFKKAADQGSANAQSIMQGFVSPTNSNAGASMKPVP
jgi:TPR repeat protein